MTLRLAFDGFRGEAVPELGPGDPSHLPHLIAQARRLLDPASALRTIHWGRNYLYLARVETASGPVDAVVKQFRERGLRARAGRARRGAGKAAHNFAVARALGAAGIATPAPLLWLEPIGGDGPSLYVCRHLPGRIEARYLLRARNGQEVGLPEGALPELAFERLLDAVAALARRLHDAGFWHRDFSAGNLLVEVERGEVREIALVDLNRCRAGAPVSPGERMRDLARLALERPEDRARLLERYFGGPPPAAAQLRYEAARRSFHGRHRFKRRTRGALVGVRAWLVPRGTHAHIPPPPEGAPARDRIVWDRLSDQPHSHAGRLGRARVRLADAGDHLASAAALAGALPRIRRRYRELVAERERTPPAPFAWPGCGVALRPWPADPEALLAAFDGLGVRQALVRLHPWQGEHGAEEALARELAGRGVELTFALPQTRELVRDPARWRAAVAELGERFAPFGRRFQIGQAINRSKWGVWSHGEYLELAASAAEILRGLPGHGPEVVLAGPAVIDFEVHATAAVLNRRVPGGRALRFDALASLLYVDRRGAPEATQLGFDTVDKVTLLAAVAETARLAGTRRHWITEVNWPLAEGPHSPAGRKVAVDEATQADYLGRFYLLALGSGLVERVFWWQLVARGYGLVDPEPLDAGGSVLRRRPAWHALAELARALPEGTLCLGAETAPPGVRRYRFRTAEGAELLALWSVGGPRRVRFEDAGEVAFDGRVRFFALDPGRSGR